MEQIKGTHAVREFLPECSQLLCDIWILEEVSKLLRLLHGRVEDSTTLVNSLSPQMSELVKDDVASWCGDIVGHFWLIKNEIQKFVELKFEFFSFNTFNVCEIFWQRVAQPRPKYSYCILLQGLCWVSVCWILNNALCSVSCVLSGFYFVPHCAINIWHHISVHIVEPTHYDAHYAQLNLFNREDLVTLGSLSLYVKKYITKNCLLKLYWNQH